MSNCAVCHKPVKSGVVVHSECMPRWISVEDRLPEPFVSVLVYTPMENPCPTVHEGFITRDGVWHSNLFDRDADEVTHWMPLPAPPEVGI